MTLTIILIACTTSEPRQCRTVELEAPGYSAAQQAVAEWLNDHEGFRVMRWSVGR